MVMFNKLVWALPVLLLYILSCSNNNNNNNNNGLVQASHEVYIHYQTLPAVSVQKLHRTSYHFQPKKHWINDPNGPFFFNGYYHLFYQYNPKGAVWGNIVWAHSVSKDLINWIPLDPAVYPSKPFDKYGCWSGSTTVLPGNKPVILYTGIIDKLNTQVQNYAVPANVSDPFLREWVKPDSNPLIVAEKGVNKTAFRDPTTGWVGADKQWRILIGGRNSETGISFLYKSKDFMKWVKSEKPLHSVDKTGNWECPDFFPVAVKGKNGLDRAVLNPDAKYVHKISLDATRYEYYTLGSYDAEKDVYTPSKTSPDNWKGLRLDYGNCYASKSFLDTQKNRRIMWSWANESDSAADDVRKGWAGIMLIPRAIWLDPSGKQLLQWPVDELETLRRKKISITNKVMKKGEKIEIKGINAAQSDVEVTFSFPGLDKSEPFDPKWENLDAQDVCNKKGSFVQGGLGPFGLATLASQNLEEYTPVFFRVFKAGNNKHKVLMCSDARKSTLKKDDKKWYKPSFGGFVDVDLAKDKKISLRSLIDNSVVESFGGGGKTCITSRVYPTMAVNQNAHLYVFNNGTEAITIDTLNAWTMKSPKEMN